MQAILTKNLFRRTEATNEVDAHGHLDKGSVIDVVSIDEGKLIDGISTWYKAADGFFYWGGGIDRKDSFNYKDIISFLPAEWLSANGKECLVIIIDTGVSINNSFFDKTLLSEISLIDNSSDNKDHGTFICGMIGSIFNIKGLAFGSKILSIRYRNENTALEKLFDNLLNALNKVKELRNASPGKRIIVNISQGFNAFQVSQFPDKTQSIITLINDLTALNVLICCAAGENKQLIEDRMLFPAKLPAVVSVGCVTKEQTGLDFSDKLTFVTPLQEYRSYDTNFQIIPDNGSSFSVAIISSIAALINRSGTLSKNDFINAVQPFSKNVAEFSFETTSYQFSVLN